MMSEEWVLLSESGQRQMVLVPAHSKTLVRAGVRFVRTPCEVHTGQLARPLVLAVQEQPAREEEAVHPLPECALRLELHNAQGERLAFGSALVATSELGELGTAVMEVVRGLGFALIALALKADGVLIVDVGVPQKWSQRALEHRAVLLEIATAHLCLARGLGEPGPIAVGPASARAPSTSR